MSTLKYTFEQLSETAKCKVREWLSPDYEWWKDGYDHAVEAGKDRGFIIDNINFSGFWSQGDGASWSGHVYITDFCKYNEKTDPWLLYVRLLVEDGYCGNTVKIRKQGWHEHSYSMYADYIDVYALDEDTDAVYTGHDPLYTGVSISELIELAEFQSAYKYIEDSARKFADEIYNNLEEEYEYITSDEYIMELCHANEYMFDEDGELL